MFNNLFSIVGIKSFKYNKIYFKFKLYTYNKEFVKRDLIYK